MLSSGVKGPAPHCPLQLNSGQLALLNSNGVVGAQCLVKPVVLKAGFPRHCQKYSHTPCNSRSRDLGASLTGTSRVFFKPSQWLGCKLKFENHWFCPGVSSTSPSLVRFEVSVCLLQNDSQTYISLRSRGFCQQVAKGCWTKSCV